ncbi:PepSY domain-containing protein [Flavobacterium sp. NKUCC04_CG]|uniref:PepSY-associated TM helix domain-containing protein n=1 Tax=Flavobacterium sp. NKUCC04_CG TaxID=2842121 RepID=UPI001C5BF557|nr:PepSY-associated TM helix domain-containing protein [Flavobacterium sp. NKUCC04_CG]MBW3520159.1 PepSY domain-containing protein [Flavobacterium sp. NKUCC04_CG]
MKKPKKYGFRRLMNDLHLWLGVASALVLFVVCLSGTIYTFRTEIEQWLEPQKYTITQTKESKFDVDELINTVALEVKGKVTRVTTEDDPTKPYVFTVSTKGDKRGENYYVNPYTKEIMGSGKGPASSFFSTVMKLHRWLLFDSEIGRPIVGIATLIFVVLCFTGMFLWFPKKIKGWKSFKPGFKIKFKSNWKRINNDLHNTLGFYTMLVVLIMAVTGLCWSFEWYRAGLSEILGVKVFGGRDEVKPESGASADAPALSYADAVALANAHFPYQGKTIVSIPKDDKGAFEIQKNDAKRWNQTAFDRIFIDQFSGDIIKTEVFSQKKIGDKIASQIKAIHLGEIYGIYSKVLYLIVCLIATSLPITGIFIWLNKMKKKPKTKRIEV